MLAVQDKPLEAVFISDLHLHPEEPAISSRFKAFIDWAAQNTKAVYILGDFFHAWSGDDGIDDWSKSIASQLKWLSEQDVALYYMHGNRDFLLGQAFASAAGITILPEPSVIQLGNNKILLVHGDRYCTNDKSHQWFRRLTRSSWFAKLFLRLPLQFRKKVVAQVRQHSQENYRKTPMQMDVVLKPMLAHMAKHAVTILIHGHTHKPGLRNHLYNNSEYKQYVLSDWDDSPKLLCYYKSKGFKFSQALI
ncbi:UDP-2,3-diacylglucosamine hydrolase [Legionella massiliensis]|uniref:UDP-2,3-diacylglucosamine hydrolase n=1 Tax=Legionella massiliensis TaxID=1034943 RepID=A0A078L2E8_9GAMM|nr:UDP-2,3-diacylglucosamine diphosphatase [Legionella massiliensis]CDZ78279.1 UDP-2,3-diacylglucosamine hydrolase [Legionella massiliensis]CEE14017.1 UDP-2,3-diacylglucosamine hydrolase [Legionella massiliensis]